MSQIKKADLHSVYIRRSMYALKLVVSLSCPSRLSDRTISRPENPPGLQDNTMILERDMQPSEPRPTFRGCHCSSLISFRNIKMPRTLENPIAAERGAGMDCRLQSANHIKGRSLIELSYGRHSWGMMPGWRPVRDHRPREAIVIILIPKKIL